MIIHETRQVIRCGEPMTMVMVEGVVDDVAVYEMRGLTTGKECARLGLKVSERRAEILGFTVPDGKVYRR